MPASSAIPADKARRIAQLVDDVRAAHRAGKDVDEQALLAAHAELMPELQVELDKLRRVRAAADAADAAEAAEANAPTAAPPIDAVARALAAELERPSIQAPGYSILRELGRGGQAVVYLAIQLSTGRKVAVKVMRDGVLADERALARFQREVQALAALNHPNIVTIFDTGRTVDGSRFIAMNYVSGSTLDQYMKYRHRKDPDDPSKLLRLFLKICSAIKAAHLRGIVHRDLKPNNIRIDERGEPQILDFGLARTAMDRFIRGSDAPISITGEFLGSLPWSSPEQAEGDPDKIDVRTDVYSLGVILYQILTGGKFPYAVVGNIRDVLNNILTADPTPPSKLMSAKSARQLLGERRPTGAARLQPAVNEAIECIVLKALAKKRERRYQSAGELARDVANYLSGRQTCGPVADESAQPSFRRHVVAATAAALLLCVAAALCGYLLLHAGHRHPAGGGTLAGQFVSVAAQPAATQPQPPAPASDASHRPAPPVAAPPIVPADTHRIAAPQQPAPTGPPTDAVAYLGNRYKFFTLPLPWDQASARCIAMGGFLARPQDGAVLAFLQTLKGDQLSAWLGASADAHGAWTWQDGRPVSSPSFDPSHLPVGYRCMFLARSGKLLARPDNGQVQGAPVPMVQGFICQWSR